jgi:hypothetical protein
MIVIGSGATAATLVPAVANDTAHVTMLQRSPTWFIPGRNAIEIAEQLRALDVPEDWVHEITRRQILKMQDDFTRRAREEPEAVKAELLGAVKLFLGEDYDIATHFTPSYRPWRQRVAFIPDGDLFQGIASGKASVVTDEIERFTEKGILLKSGKELEADIIVTATGFDLEPLGHRSAGSGLELADAFGEGGSGPGPGCGRVDAARDVLALGGRFFQTAAGVLCVQGQATAEAVDPFGLATQFQPPGRFTRRPVGLGRDHLTVAGTGGDTGQLMPAHHLGPPVTREGEGVGVGIGNLRHRGERSRAGGGRYR